MAGQVDGRQNLESDAPPPEAVVDLGVELAEESDGSVDDSVVDVDDVGKKKLLFAKSTDIRRRIEEQLEVKLLKDQLGIDNLDI